MARKVSDQYFVEGTDSWMLLCMFQLQRDAVMKRLC